MQLKPSPMSNLICAYPSRSDIYPKLLIQDNGHFQGIYCATWRDHWGGVHDVRSSGRSEDIYIYTVTSSRTWSLATSCCPIDIQRGFLSIIVNLAYL